MNEGSPTLTEADQRRAIATLRMAAANGALTESQLRAMVSAVWASNTPRELYLKTDGFVGDPTPRDGWSTRRILTFYAMIPVALVVVTIFAALAVRMGLVG